MKNFIFVVGCHRSWPIQSESETILISKSLSEDNNDMAFNINQHPNIAAKINNI